MKIKLAIKIIFFGIFVLSGCFFCFQSETNKYFLVSFLDVGQGDASLVRLDDGKIILLDGGPDDLILSRLGEALPPWRRKINFIVISHFHDDHIAGLISVLERYRVEKIIFAAGLEKFVLGEYLLRRAREKEISLVEVDSQASWRLNSGCNFLLLNPLSLGALGDSNNSLVAKLDCSGRQFLFAGDNEKKVEDLLLASSYDLSADVLKSSHHGSKTSNQLSFLTEVNPKILVISVGQGNNFGHPSPDILEAARLLNIEIKRTDELGTVRFKINFANIK